VEPRKEERRQIKIHVNEWFEDKVQTETIQPLATSCTGKHITESLCLPDCFMLAINRNK
jgi:hypothetical protein